MFVLDKALQPSVMKHFRLSVPFVNSEENASVVFLAPGTCVIKLFGPIIYFIP
jgi:hypothetical protein